MSHSRKITPKYDFQPQWYEAPDEDVVAPMERCWVADWDDLSPLLALVDAFAERGDAREHWIRAAWNGRSKLIGARRYHSYGNDMQRQP